jgi:hypothetical protein
MGVKWGDDLAHTHRTEDKLRHGHYGEAVRDHNAHLAAEMARAKTGATINLSDLMAAREVLADPSIVRRAR